MCTSDDRLPSFPLTSPLIDTPPHPLCRASVIVPVRDEADKLPRMLDALRLQRDMPVAGGDRPLHHDTYEVLLLLNNCTDGTEAVAEAYRQAHPGFRLHLAIRTLAPEDANVGTARRLLMDTAYQRMCSVPHSAILSTDGDTNVAPDWIARNLHALHLGADVVGGVIHLFPEELEELERTDPAVVLAYRSDRELQRLAARLESLLDPDPADPWPRHLEQFGASLACTPHAYALAGGLPHVDCLEDVAFIDALRKADANIRHCTDVHVFTSPRLHGRARMGLSGHLRFWQQQAHQGLPHTVDSAAWLTHRFSSMAALRNVNSSANPHLTPYPDGWRERIAELHAEKHSTPRFLELLDCNRLIEELFEPLDQPRRAEITRVIDQLEAAIDSLLQAQSSPAPALAH